MSGTLPEILTGEFAPSRQRRDLPRTIRVVDWNIDRGLNLPGILDFLASFDADLLLLQELDLNARRTHRVNVAEQIARRLKMNYVWAREFQELLQGTSSSPAYHGQATLARWQLDKPRLIRFRNQSNFWRPHWFVPRTYPFQVRLGGRIALITEMQGSGRSLAAYNLHLESRGEDSLRVAQLGEALADSARYSARTPVLVSGDFNLNATHRAAAAEMSRYGFQSVLNPHPGPTAHVLFFGGPAIDWVYIRGPVQAQQPKVHTRIRASDHFPISFTLTFS